MYWSVFFENDLAGLLSTLPLPFVSSSLPAVSPPVRGGLCTPQAVSFTVVPLVGAFLRLAGGKPFPYKQSKAPSSEGGRTLACQLKNPPYDDLVGRVHCLWNYKRLMMINPTKAVTTPKRHRGVIFSPKKTAAMVVAMIMPPPWLRG